MFERITPTNKAIILANIGVFALQYLLGNALTLFALWPPQSGLFRPWQVLTYGFLHSTQMFAHIAFNMFAVFMFGSEVERLFGPKRYLIYYLTCVVGAALMHLIVVTVANLPPYPTVGASGAVFGLLLAYGMAYPYRKLIVIPIPVPMPAWLLVTLYGAVELYMGITSTMSGVAHFAHLGGMATGFVLIRYWQSQRRRPRQ
jgi:membrane associated rhomboid family serine protease